MLAEADWPSTHNLVYDVAGEEKGMEVEEDEDEENLLPPAIMQLGDRSRKRSSGRATVPDFSFSFRWMMRGIPLSLVAAYGQDSRSYCTACISAFIFERIRVR
jgi:hypothetical protein